MTNCAGVSVYNDTQEKDGEVGRSFVTGTFYLDLYFLINFFMDLILLSMVRRILKLPLRKKRILLAGLAGAVWACVAVFVPVISPLLEILITWIIGGGILVVIAYGKMGILDFGRTICTLWMVSAAAGGILIGLGDHVQTGKYLRSGGNTAHFSVISLVCWIAGIYFGICACMAVIKTRIQEQKHLYEVTLSYQGKKKVVTALLDTGNQLYEPYGHEPVHVITCEACTQLCEVVSQMIYIPFRAVGTECGMLPAIRIDEMSVSQDGKLVKVLEKPWIAISKEPLSPGRRYEMLLHGENEN